MRDLAEDFIARLPAEKIVDGTKTVEIGDADGKGSRIVRTFQRELLHLFTQTVTIPESSQEIGETFSLLSWQDGLCVGRFHQTSISREGLFRLERRC